VLPYNTLRLAGPPDDDVEVAISYLHCRTDNQINAIAVIEVLTPDVEAGLLEQSPDSPGRFTEVTQIENFAP
jgi:hypothetical protein